MQRGAEVVLDSRDAISTNNGEASGSAIRISGSGSGLYMEEDAKLDIHGGTIRNNHSSISLTTSGASLKLATMLK